MIVQGVFFTVARCLSPRAKSVPYESDNFLLRRLLKACYHPHCEGVIVLRSVRLWVCLLVCLSVNMITPEPVRDIITKFSGHHSTVKRADKFEKWL